MAKFNEYQSIHDSNPQWGIVFESVIGKVSAEWPKVMKFVRNLWPRTLQLDLLWTLHTISAMNRSIGEF